MSAPSTAADGPRNRKDRGLGFRGLQVLAFVRRIIAETGTAPSYTEISKALNFADRADVCRVVARLEKRGLLHRAGHGRTKRIRLTGA